MSDEAQTTRSAGSTSATSGGGIDHAVATWMAGQRWYAAKGLDPELRVIASVEEHVDDLDGTAVRVVTNLVIDDAPTVPVLYQVPVTVRSAPVAGLDAALVAEDDGRWVYDGPHDTAYARWLLATIAGSRSVSGGAMGVDGQAIRTPGALVSSRVLRGEQSNTSIICDVDSGHPADDAHPADDGHPADDAGAADDTGVPQVIVKVFRVLHHGENPDVTTQAALSVGGSRRVPTSIGALSGTWPDVGRDEGTATGHLAFAQEFMPGLEDAWRVALAAAEAGTDFTDEARALGAAVAEVHATLATTLPTIEAGPDEVAAMLGSMRERIDVTAAEVPAIAEHADAIRALYAATEELDWPRLQRIHGDLHLGQALSSPDRGWILLDFEGEPLRPMPERSRPDLTLRDVAGMLRSFDYVAGAIAHGAGPAASATAGPVDPDTAASAEHWADAARRAFVDGYTASSGVDLHAERRLLDAFEVDKAVYEALYEARNRPDWVGIPVTAVGRLVARSAPDALADADADADAGAGQRTS
ncbi:maltokinase N-terminal cap-like domain-containing protein [Curtobacterium sp. RRHDQ10]|uniref:maltokinase N-terminal cap-like domain-containing protein n=1 Tax=Curtobacterium phyllosphaerae TaxID=3413379 RepID=UPI003BF142C7